MRTIYDIDKKMTEKEKMGTENVGIFLQVVKKSSHLYTKEQVKEIERVITNKFPVYVFEGAILREFLKNARLGKDEMILKAISELKKLFFNYS